MRRFRWYEETEPGLVVRKPPENQITAAGMAALDRAMVVHFGRLFARPELAALRARRYERVVSVGGGHPNLEASLNAGGIVVADPLWRLYANQGGAFRAAWPKAPPVEWRRCPMTFSPEVMDGADLVVFCHVLEHLSIDRARRYIEAVPATADLLIYGPCSDRMTSDDWQHARPVHQHLWLPGLAWMRTWAERHTGRAAQIAIAHDEDLLLWLPAREDASGGRGTGAAPRTPQTVRATAGTDARPAEPAASAPPSPAVGSASSPGGLEPTSGPAGDAESEAMPTPSVSVGGTIPEGSGVLRTAGLPAAPDSGCGGTPLQTRSNQSGSPPEASGLPSGEALA